MEMEKIIEEFKMRVIPYNRNFKFKGWAYTELLEFYKIKPIFNEYTSRSNSLDGLSDVNALLLRNILMDVMDSKNKKNLEICNKAIKDFIKAMLKHKKIDIYHPIWEAMLTLNENDKDYYELLKVTYHLIEMMWT